MPIRYDWQTLQYPPNAFESDEDKILEFEKAYCGVSPSRLGVHIPLGVTRRCQEVVGLRW
jgi:hypothetical protein